jgi:hypothetical protein
VHLRGSPLPPAVSLASFEDALSTLRCPCGPHHMVTTITDPRPALPPRPPPPTSKWVAGHVCQQQRGSWTCLSAVIHLWLRPNAWRLSPVRLPPARRRRLRPARPGPGPGLGVPSGDRLLPEVNDCAQWKLPFTGSNRSNSQDAHGTLSPPWPSVDGPRPSKRPPRCPPCASRSRERDERAVHSSVRACWGVRVRS